MSPRWMCIAALLVGSASAASAQQANDPLRFVPSQAEWVAKIDRPRELVDAIEKNDLFQQAQKLAVVREYYDSTTAQRLYQLLAYFEKELGKNKTELLDDLGAGGIAITAQFSPPSGVLFVLQAKDESRLRRFVDLSLDLIEKELDRQESKDRIVRAKYQGVDIGQLGPKVSFAVVEAALLIGSDDKMLKTAIDTHRKQGKSILQVASFMEARKKAPPKSLGWTWFHLEEIRTKIPKFQDGLNAAALDPFQVFVFGGITDLLKRSPYVSAALTRDGADYRLAVQSPSGRDGMPALSHMLLPTDGAGTLPPLLAPRTIASASYFFDLGQFWTKRADIVGEKNAKGLDDADQNLAKFLAGIKLGKLLNAMGPHHRVVVTQPKDRPYQRKPAAPIPSFALVVDMRDPSFAKDMNSIFRSGALLATFVVGLNLKEETHNDCEMVSYFFSETKKVEGDPTNIRFNFSPTYVAVGDQFVMSSTAELARDLIDSLKAERDRKPSKATMRTQLHASGLAEIIKANEEAVLTQLILSQALPSKTAKQELGAILSLVEQLGSLRFESEYSAKNFRYDILWKRK